MLELNLENVIVTQNEEAQRFQAAVDGLLALITYRRFPDHLALLHTGVPVALQHQGLAAKLTRTALDFARAHHLRVAPLCPYVAAFLKKHREYQDLLSAEDLKRISSR